MTAQNGHPHRVRVTAPPAPALTAADLGRARRSASGGDPDDLFLRSLMRSQLRLAAAVAGGFLVLLTGIPILLAASPQLAGLTMATVPLPWLLLGGAVYPLLHAAAVLYVRGASRNERRFRELLASTRESGEPGTPGESRQSGESGKYRER